MADLQNIGINETGENSNQLINDAVDQVNKNTSATRIAQQTADDARNEADLARNEANESLTMSNETSNRLDGVFESIDQLETRKITRPPGGNSSNFLRGDNVWAVPPGGGTGGDVNRLRLVAEIADVPILDFIDSQPMFSNPRGAFYVVRGNGNTQRPPLGGTDWFYMVEQLDDRRIVTAKSIQRPGFCYTNSRQSGGPWTGWLPFGMNVFRGVWQPQNQVQAIAGSIVSFNGRLYENIDGTNGTGTPSSNIVRWRLVDIGVDEERGTWTPLGLPSGAQSSINTWQRIGNRLFFNTTIIGIPASNFLYLGGLPFAISGLNINITVTSDSNADGLVPLSISSFGSSSILIIANTNFTTINVSGSYEIL